MAIHGRSFPARITMVTAVLAVTSVDGTAAITQDGDTFAAAGTVPADGTIAVTQAGDTFAGSGYTAVTGTAAVTQAGDAVSAVGSTYSGLYPATVSSRKLLDQHGSAVVMKSFSSWSWAQNGTNAEITDHLEFVAGLGFDTVTMAPCGIWQGVDWERWENGAGDPFFTGTPLASSFGSAWASVDWFMTEASRLGLTVLFSIYTGYNLPPRQGIGDQLLVVTNMNAYDYGVAVGQRYAAYPNIVWHYGADEDFDWGATLATRVDNVFHGLVDADTAAGRTRLQVAEPYDTRTGYDQFISQEGNGTTGYGWLNLSTNAIYNGGGAGTKSDAVEAFDAVYTETGATTIPVWDCELPYVDAGSLGFNSGNEGQQQRERVLSTIIRGGIGFNFSHAAGWGVKALTNYTTTTEDWTDVYTNTIVLGMAHINDMVDLIQGVNWAPNDSFVTTGIGSGDTKAAAGTNGSIAVAYFPSNRTTVVDTTIISGTAPVRLRWWNPQDGTFTSIATSEAQNASRSVTIPAAHGDGTRDWLLFVDEASNEGTVAITQADDTFAATGTTTVTGTAAVTQAGDTFDASGTTTVTGTSAITQAADTMAASGYAGNDVAAWTQADDTLAATGTVPAVGSAAIVQDGDTLAAVGTSTIEGTIAVTQDGDTFAASGNLPLDGTITIVQADQTMVAYGTNEIVGYVPHPDRTFRIRRDSRRLYRIPGA